MSTLNHSGSNNKTTEILPSPADQQSEQSVLLPFSGELRVDDKLNFSNADFKQTIHDFFKGKNITALNQLTEIPAFPTPHVLAKFASKAYTDCKQPETNAQYETGLALPGGWELLTTASNNERANGYFGAGYWHPEHQQVVIAHRGTKPTNLGALWADFQGVMRNHYVGQMESASTFADEVVEVLDSVRQEKGVVFQLFYTGHSLGGWLAQTTTFTTKYLNREGNIFVKSKDDNDCYHPHTVVFDSPGCQDMLSQMTDKFDVRLDGRSIDIEILDITSYLSAPNLINACNRHVGTVYRIFPDLSDIGWLGKNTAWYNKVTHSMDKIVKAFEPVTGQEDNDGKSEVKIKVVVDWPVTAGLFRSEEYKSFFNWAKHFNDYNPEVTDQTFRLKGYTSMRYQTKTYDERVSRLSVFCQREREFLESYRWLRKVPEFFKTKELFSVMEDNQAQEHAKKILQDFKIENDQIGCTDGSELQALIPYVKRLLQLFPGIKDSTTRALSSDEVRNSFYQIGTNRCIERINQSPLDIKRNDLSISDFVRSDHQQVLQLQMVGGDEWTGILKIYQVLQKTGCLSTGQYTVLNLERLLTVNHLVDFSTVMQSTVTPHLLLMACDTNQLLNDEAQHIIRKLFNIVKDKPDIKIFFSTRSECATLHTLQQIGREIFGKAFVTREEQLTWSDLTTASKEKLLEKSVKFQGAKSSLNKLMSAASPLSELLPLGALLEEEQLTIADPVPISSGYNEGYYIGRTFLQHRAINEEILIDKRKEDFPDLIASTEQEFKTLCEMNPKSNVHWLEKEKSGELVWQQSQGSLETLRRYINTTVSHTYTADDIEKLLEQAQHQRVMLISDTAGMGKSTVLTHLSKQIKQKFPAKWVVRIDLNDHIDALANLKREEIGKMKAIEFVSENLLKLQTGLEMELFKQCCEQKQKVGIVIMLDGFDEICPHYKETVIDLLQPLRQTAVEQLWVTTRPNLREELEDELQQLSYTIQTFSEENQIEFLTKFWSLKDWVTKMDNNEEEENNKKLEIYAKELIKKLVKLISDQKREFTGIPLQTRMLAEAFEREVQIFCQSPESTLVLPTELDLIALYRKFIESKYNIYQEEKFQVRKTNVMAQEQRERDLKLMREDHKLLALKLLFNRETVALLQDNREGIFSAKQLSRIGIAQVRHDGKLHFIHRTFAEYYVADCLVNRLTEGNNISEQIQNFILKDIFLEIEYRMIRVFIDGLLSSTKPPNAVLQQYGNRIHEVGEYGVKILHQAAREDNANIVGFLLHSVQAGQQTDTLNELLLKQDDEGRTAWHKAVLMGNIQVLMRLWEWAKKVLKTQELKSELLLAKLEFRYTDIYDIFSDIYKNNTALQKAAQEGKSEVFLKVWEWTKQELTTEEIKNEVLLAKDESKQTIWHMAATNGNIQIVEKIWEWAKEKLTTQELKNELLLAKDDMEKTAFHIAAVGGKTQVLQEIWEWSTEKLSAEEINELLLAKDEMKETAFRGAARWGQTEVLQKLWEWGNEKLTPEELKSNLLLKEKDEEEAPFHVAAHAGQTEALQKLWEWGKEKLTPEELKNTFLLTQYSFHKTVLHVAADDGNTDVLRKVWAWGKEELTPEELKDKFLLAKCHDLTAFHYAALQTNIEALHEMWDCAKEKLTKEELNYKLLLAKDSMGRTAWHNAAVGGHIEVLETLWEWAKGELTSDELKNNLLLGKDYKERTAWHLAAELGYVNILVKVWEWAKQELTREELHNRFLLATDDKEHTAWHEAIDQGNTEILKEMWDFAKRELNTEELYNELLLAKFDGETTAWHVAAIAGNDKLLENLWEWGKEIQNKDELNKNLLLARDKEERTALHVATHWDRMEVLEKLWEFANEETSMPEVVKKLLLATDSCGVTAWHIAVIRGDKYLLEQLWKWAKEKLTTDELKHKLFLAKHSWGRTAWHDAVEGDDPEILDILWEWGKEQLTTEELSNKLLLAKDDKQNNAWQLAAKLGNTESLQKIWEWAKAGLSTEELNNKFLLAKDDRKMTAWHMAADCDNIESLQTIWEWAKQVLTAEELKNRLLLAKDDREQTVFEAVAENGNTDMLEILHQWAVEELTAEELNNISSLSTHTSK